MAHVVLEVVAAMLIKTRFHHLLLTLMIGMLCSCAGPMNPFGSVNNPFAQTPMQDDSQVVKALAMEIIDQEEELLVQLKERAPASVEMTALARALSKKSAEAKGAVIRFAPEEQVLTRSAPLKINIIDPAGIGPNHKVKIYYNKKDITKQVLAKAKNHRHQAGTQMDLDIDSIRFTSGKEHHIYVSYQRTPFHSPVVAQYRGPNCSVKGQSKIYDLDELKEHRWIIKAIETHAKKFNINPGLLVGLVAQESAFNPKAVSWAKAVGLTQVTPLANAHVMKSYVHWPYFEGMRMMSIPEIKMNIDIGRINYKNEWRLDVDKSIIGGLYYLDYLIGYWEKSRTSKSFKKQRYQNVFNTSYSDIILASYNSGPARVKKALRQLGPRWRESSELGEARKYMAKVKSYCREYSEVTYAH